MTFSAEVTQAARDWETFSSKHTLNGAVAGGDAQCPIPDDIPYKGLFVPPRELSQRMLEEDPPNWNPPRQAYHSKYIPIMCT